MNVAQAILTQLSNWGVKRIYGVVGGHIFQLAHEFSSHPDITFYPVVHEETASLMASAQAKLTGEIGVCLSTGGPGAVHLLNGVADAYKDKVPVLAITGDEATSDLGTEKKQVINQRALFSGITCLCAQIVHEQTVGDVFVRALSEAQKSSLPAHVSIPKDILSQDYTGQIFSSAPFMDTLPKSSPQVVKDAAEKLSQAKKPAILAGKGVVDGSNDVLALAEKWQAPIILTSAARSLFPHDHSLVLGGIGDGGSEAATNIMNEADFVLAIGANWWPEKYINLDMNIFQIDVNPASITTGNPTAFGLVGNVSDVVKQLRQLIEPVEHNDWLKKIRAEKTNWEDRIKEELKKEGSPCPPESIIGALNKAVASDAIISLDVGDHFLWFNRLFAGTGQTPLMSGKWRTLGFGLPGALAAKINYPERQVVALVGDGGFNMVLHDFLTAVKQNLAVTILVVNNGSYSHNPDYKQFAESCGGVGFTVKESKELENTLKQALECNKPCIVDIHTDTTKPPTIA